MTDSPPHPQPRSSPSFAIVSLSSLDSAREDAFDPIDALRQHAESTNSDPDETTLLRVFVLRRAHPDASIVTELARVDGNEIAVKASVSLPTGATATSYAVSSGGIAALERTEHRAIGRALDLLGEVVLIARPDITVRNEPSIEQHHPSTPSATPGPPRVDESEPGLDPSDEEFEQAFPVTPRSEEAAAPATAARQAAPPTSDSTRPPSPPPAVVDAMRRANLRRRPAPGQSDMASENVPPITDSSAPASDASSDDTPLENYSWTAFWRRARQEGLDKAQVEELIGQPIGPLTPLQVREALLEAGVAI